MRRATSSTSKTKTDPSASVFLLSCADMRTRILPPAVVCGNRVIDAGAADLPHHPAATRRTHNATWVTASCGAQIFKRGLAIVTFSIVMWLLAAFASWLCGS